MISTKQIIQNLSYCWNHCNHSYDDCSLGGSLQILNRWF